MQRPKYGRPRSASAAFGSLSRGLPPLKGPLGTSIHVPSRPRPKVARPQRPLAAHISLNRNK
ncbi:MAG TPA: hypothetical protein VFN10_11440 [Thermoanaerobaculia bacterium]|nr:hypothetical protein [Thermoanaerobaculia bacterium]